MAKDKPTPPGVSDIKTNTSSSLVPETELPMTLTIGEGEERDTQNLVYTIPVDHRGTSVYLRGWLQPEPKYPPVVLVHDLGENVRHYKRVAEGLMEAGFSVFGFDLRGHGRSGSMLGHVPHFDDLVKDLLQVVSWIRYKSDRQLPIIIGQGVGALVTIFFQKKYPKFVRETVLVSPVLSEGNSISPMYRALIRTMAEVMPRMRLPKTIVPKFLSMGGHAPSAKQQRYRGITMNFAKEVINAIGEVEEIFLQFKGPSLIIIPQQVDGYDRQTLKALLERHPQGEHLTLIEVGNIGTQPLARSKEFAVVLESVYPWLEEKFGVTIERGNHGSEASPTSPPN